MTFLGNVKEVGIKIEGLVDTLSIEDFVAKERSIRKPVNHHMLVKKDLNCSFDMTCTRVSMKLLLP